MGDVRLLAGEKVVEADHVVLLLDQTLAEVRAEEAGPTGHQDAFDLRHGNDFRSVEGQWFRYERGGQGSRRAVAGVCPWLGRSLALPSGLSIMPYEF